MMELKVCSECKVEAWHNSLGGKQAGWRCTYCGYPVGTGPKADRLRPINVEQVNKAKAKRA